MEEIRDDHWCELAHARALGAEPAPDDASPARSEDARRMRALLKAFAQRAAAGHLPVRVPRAAPIESRVTGHFHLAPEMFLQVAGSTDFDFPHDRLTLQAGEALVLPPKLLHDERVRAGPGESFCNIVVYAESASLSCHLAHEAEAGRPGIRYLEARHHARAGRILGWLDDAARMGEASAGDDSWAWAALQARSLVAAAMAGVAMALDDAGADERPEPPLVARVRVLVQNQLGDHELSVRRLAEQSGCTADYLSHVFGQTAGEHLVAYINRQRMERAVSLLRDSGLAGKEVAWACGFSTQSYFIRSFRSQFGVTPKTWRLAHAASA